MAEWLNAPVSKTGMGASPSGVRIPPSPPALPGNYLKNDTRSVKRNHGRVKGAEKALLKLGAVYFDDSANYKRWGRRNERGRIIEAYGINLSPLGRLTNHLRNMDELMAGKRQAWRQAKSAYSGVRRYIKQLLISERGNEIDLESALTEFESLVANMKSRPRTRTEDYQAWLAKLEGFRDHLEALLDDPIEVPYEMPCEQPVENPQVSGKMSPKTRCT